MISVDTGAFVALFNQKDPYHPIALQVFQTIREQLITTYPVVTETCYLLTRFNRMIPHPAQKRFLQSLAQGAVEIFPLERPHLTRIIALMDQYADLPMDLADASLIVLAEHLSHGRILTVDQRDFNIYQNPPQCSAYTAKRLGGGEAAGDRREQ